MPAAFVGGAATDAELHAWVMWVELLSVTKTAITFTLQSEGRYADDKFYVGQLADPHTGQWITDRQLELRLHSVGMNPQASRHAKLIMLAYPMLRDKTHMAVTDQLVFLNQVVKLCPGNEDAWIAMSKISRQGGVPRSIAGR